MEVDTRTKKTHGNDMEEEETAEGKSGGGHPAYSERNLCDTTSDTSMVDGEQPAVPSPSGKSEGAANRHKEATEEEE